MAEIVEKTASELGLSYATEEFSNVMDTHDPLRIYRSEFAFPSAATEQPYIYLCGNSLGLMPFSAKSKVNQSLDKWATSGVNGHFEGPDKWVDAEGIACRLMTEIVGANESEIAIMNGLSVNLHLMLTSFFRPTKDRFKILVEDGLFCSDSHVILSQLRLHGLCPEEALLKAKPESGRDFLATEDIIQQIEAAGDSLCLVFFSGVQYYTGQFFDMAAITAAGHKVGARVGFDLAHAVGNVELHLHDWNVDFACWCSYKYLNAGPGGIAGAFVHEMHDSSSFQRLDGWQGQALEDVFLMRPVHNPAKGAAAYRISNPCILSISSLIGALEIFQKATMSRITAKQILLTGYLELLLKQTLLPEDMLQITPANPRDRGSQLSIKFTKPIRDVQGYLQKNGVICDVRKPGVLRITPAPLYNSFNDVYKFVMLLRDAVDSV
uniref:Kynureninase n=1 Tax=Spongospora subterranea TaxID=70186 RepID=A0A0H5QHU8_9EUKA|eukprot:CRZ01227.1 hypothetical protein [Spongospora subterranea]